MHEHYKRLAQRLDALPNGYPETADGIELRILAKLFSPEEAELAAQLRITLETPAEIAERIGGDASTLRKQLKDMARRGLIKADRTDHGLGYGLLPFVVGIYEMQTDTIDEELARMFEEYYLQVFGHSLNMQPQVHRVIPVNESIAVDLEIQPFETAASIVDNAKAWGVTDCICRKQKALIGEPCKHPIDICMVFSDRPGAFDNAEAVQALTRDGAMATLQRAADAGLVHTVNNVQEGMTYICNCCTCSCGILRGIADLGIANVVARSAFVNTIDEDRCLGCEDCVPYCQFNALAMKGDTIHVDETRCVGCGVCVVHCVGDAMTLVRRPDEAIKPVPVSESEWLVERAAMRHIDLGDVL
jgi:electron transport complex protein RnfB